MADNFEQPGQGPQGGSPPGGGNPSDFFADPANPPASSLTPHEPPVNPPPARPAPPPRPGDDTGLPPIGPPSSFRPPDDIQLDDDEPRKSPFPAILGALFAATLVVAWIFNMQKPSPAVAATPAPAPSSVVEPTPPAPALAQASAPAPSAPATADTESIDGKVKALASKVDELTAQVKAFEAKLNDLPKPAPPPDLKPLEGKLNDLGKSVGAVAPLNDKVSKLGERFGSVDDALKSIKGDLAALKDEVRKPATAPGATETKPAADDTAAAMTGGVDLFKAGKYKEAGDVFKKLASANPKDARVYYYAALTRGLTTNDWQGETLATAAKGAELEKAGSPRAPEVDATFADLPSTLKPWVAFFRQQAK